LPAPRAAVPCRPYEPSQNSPCPSTIQASCPPEGPLVPHATFISDAFGLLSTTSHLLKIQRAPRLTTGFVQPSMVWRLRASRMLNTLGPALGRASSPVPVPHPEPRTGDREQRAAPSWMGCLGCSLSWGCSCLGGLLSWPVSVLEWFVLGVPLSWTVPVVRGVCRLLCLGGLSFARRA